MKRLQTCRRRSLSLTLGALVILAAGCAGMSANMPTLLSGAQEVPIVTTGASGRADVSVDWFKCPAAASSDNCPTLFGTVATAGTAATQVEIREGVPGHNGPRVVTLMKTGDNTWQVPSGTILTPAQYEAYRQGQFYVNVDSVRYRSGELRAQLTP
jgi:hypothetical protein